MNQQKTVKEWLELLPEPYRSQALENVSEHISMSKQKTIFKAIDSFEWYVSNQGFYYWLDVYSKLKSGKIKLTNEQ